MSSDEFVLLPCPHCGGRERIDIATNRTGAPGRWSGRCLGCGQRWTFDDD
ncbi:hypothetical protein QDR37_06045 [Amnibacterium sp. CER49]|nr:hypothetical protein [Amnibacterium sp. CER49]MDH2443501.1 hypothetical protein [Amnibacterium sp. CER49]